MGQGKFIEQTFDRPQRMVEFILMKTRAQRFLVFTTATILFAALTCSADLTKKPDDRSAFEKSKDKVKETVKDGKEATKQGVKLAGDFAAKTHVQIKSGLRRAGQATSHGLAKAKEAVSDAVDVVKEKAREITR